MPKPTKTWKLLEKQIGELFRGVRNPLSGRNNVSDQGKKRLGDVIVPELEEKRIPYLIETKLYKSIATITRAKDTQKLAKEHDITSWFHIERQNGTGDIIVFAVNKEWADKIAKFILDKLQEGDVVG